MSNTPVTYFDTLGNDNIITSGQTRMMLIIILAYASIALAASTNFVTDIALAWHFVAGLF